MSGTEKFDLSGKNIAITGASSGFGHHFASVLADAGASVVLGARRVDKIEDRVRELTDAGHKAAAIPLDVNDSGSVLDFLTGAEEAFGQIDVVINNAGVESGAKTYAMIDESDWDYVMNTNLKAPWFVSKAYTERVAERGWKGGNIINIASITAFRTIKGQFPYAVSKAGLVKMTEIMALEAAKYGIRVNALAPGYILTDISRILLESDQSDTFRKRIPMRRYGDFPDLDGPILLLASNASSYMTGSVIVVDGGHICSEL